MSALISSSARTGRFWPAGRAGRRAGVLAVPLLAAAALAAGCGSAHTAVPAGGLAGRGSGHATGPTVLSVSATPVPTVIGGAAAAGGIACVGWPTDAGDAPLPASFTVVSVERCVNGTQTVPGKGLWTSATLQRADSGLTGLVTALRRHSGTRQPGTMCPALAIIPPQIVLIAANGQKLIPRLPVTGCGLVQPQVLAALNELRWQTVSVRLISQIPGAVPGTKAPTVPGTAPRPVQTVSGARPQ